MWLAPFQIHCLDVIICWCKIDLRWSCAHFEHLAGSMKSGAVCSMPVHVHHFATRNDKKSAFSSHFSCGQGFLIIVLGVQPFFPYPGNKNYPYSLFCARKYILYVWLYIVCIRLEKLQKKMANRMPRRNCSEVFLPTVLPSFHLLIPKMSANAIEGRTQLPCFWYRWWLSLVFRWRGLWQMYFR